MPLQRPLKVGALITEALSPFEFAVAFEVFGLDRPESPEIAYTFATLGECAGLTARQGPLAALAQHDLDGVTGLNTIIIPGWPVYATPSEHMVDVLRRAADAGVRIASFCSGAFLLAACGLLDGRTATTHWKHAALFKSRFPRVHLDPARLWVSEQNIYTAAGSAAAIDLSLHLVREDYGAQAANIVARRLVAAPVRAGGQAQFIERAAPKRTADEKLNQLINGLTARLGSPLTIEALAREAGMSRRTFIRRFEAAAGTPPGRWIMEQRIRRAQALLETSSLSVDEIAFQCGFASAGGFRDRFQTIVGAPPGAYRKRFFVSR